MIRVTPVYGPLRQATEIDVPGFALMPRFFFHSEDGECFQDKEGTELPDLATAKREGVQVLGDLMLHDPDLFLATDRFRVIIQDENHLTVYVVDLSGVASAGVRA